MPAKTTSEPSTPVSLDDQPCLDPVCGEEIARPELAPRVTRNGERFFFCSDRCKTRFLLDPQRYLVSGVEIT